MTIEQIKAAIAKALGIELPALVLVRQFAIDGVTPEPWVSHWDNTNRVRISMHQDILTQLKADPKKTGLAFKQEIVAATESRAAYKRVVIITPRNIEATF